jgi:hypothetical protein
MSATSSMLVWEHNPCIRRYVSEALVIIALLVDRSWAFWGCIDNKLFC